MPAIIRNIEIIMTVNPFRGLGIALVTPFSEDGSVDFAALVRLVDYQIENGADFVCVLGTTGETPCLTSEECEKIKRTVVDTVKGRVPVLLGMSDNCTARLTAAVKNADFSGIDGILSSAPSYNKPVQEGIYRHLRALSEVSPLPIVLYNIPGRTGVNISAEITLRLASDCDNIVAVKEASGNITQIADILQAKPQDFDVLSGDDAITFEMLGLGAVGVISVIGNAYPALFSKMIKCHNAGNESEALAVHRSMNELYKLMSVDGNPAGVKSLLALQGKIDNVLRLPLVPASQSTQDALKKVIAELG